MNLRAALAVLSLLVGAAGCGGDNPPNQPPSAADLAMVPATPADMAMGTGGNGASGTITGKVTYTGSKMGTLKFALYDKMPGATTPPKYFMFPTVDNPTFPYTYTLMSVVPGSYWVAVILDVPPASPAIPGMEDVVGTSMGQVTVPAGGTGTMDVTLPSM